MEQQQQQQQQQQASTVEALRTHLEERLETHDDNRKVVQEKLHGLCEKLRGQINEMEDRISKELESEFKAEDDRLQGALYGINSCDTTNEEEALSFIQKARAELLVRKSYSLEEVSIKDAPDISQLYKLKVQKEVVPTWVNLDSSIDLKANKTDVGKVHLDISHLNEDEERILNESGLRNKITYIASLKKKDDENDLGEYVLKNNISDGNDFTFNPDRIEPSTTYTVCVKAAFQDRESQNSDKVEFVTPGFEECCAWKECPDNIDEKHKYVVDEMNPRIATTISGYSSVIGNTAIPPNRVISWNVKVLKSKNNDGSGIGIGVAPFDINQNSSYNDNKRGWYFDCYVSSLRSGPPHKYSGRVHGPRKGAGRYVHTGDSVCVVMDTTKGELSFILDGMDLGVAYEEIPLDKPLVPCVLLLYPGDSVEIDPSGAKENEVDSSIPVPSNVVAKSTRWKSITITWDKVLDASSYQLEFNGKVFIVLFSTNTFTKKGLLPDTEYSFRVRAIKDGSVGKWSDIVKERTQKDLFEYSVWEECPDFIDVRKKYTIDENNPRVAAKERRSYGGDCCAVLGDTHLLPNKVTSWSIRMLCSRANNGGGTQIGVAQLGAGDSKNCGWYFDCYYSVLNSGPPHNYKGNKSYGPRKGDGEYVHTGDSVGVVMDTTKGDLSFVLNGVNHGIAYEGIPLDKPLVPCVLLWCNGDSVELII